MSELHSTATVQTDRSERWIKQLASHLGRKAEVEQRDADVLLHLAGGTCAMSSDGAGVHLRASAPDAEALDRVQQVVGGHFERFAQAEGVVVTWSRA